MKYPHIYIYMRTWNTYSIFILAKRIVYFVERLRSVRSRTVIRSLSTLQEHKLKVTLSDKYVAHVDLLMNRDDIIDSGTYLFGLC
jgi:hypothetical protein